jgi:hypothetical protein
VINSISVVAEEEFLVITDRITWTRPDLTDAAFAALDNIRASRAAKIAASSR